MAIKLKFIKPAPNQGRWEVVIDKKLYPYAIHKVILTCPPDRLDVLGTKQAGDDLLFIYKNNDLETANKLALEYIFGATSQVLNQNIVPPKTICNSCHQHFPYAEYQSDFKCWGCRNGY